MAHLALFGEANAAELKVLMQRNAYRSLRTYGQVVNSNPSAMRQAIIGSPTPLRRSSQSAGFASPAAFGLASTPLSARNTGGSSGQQQRMGGMGGFAGVAAGGREGGAGARGTGSGGGIASGQGGAGGSSGGFSPGVGQGRAGPRGKGSSKGGSAGKGRVRGANASRSVSPAAAAAAAAGQGEAGEAHPDLFEPAQRPRGFKRRR